MSENGYGVSAQKWFNGDGNLGAAEYKVVKHARLAQPLWSTMLVWDASRGSGALDLHFLGRSHRTGTRGD